MSEIGFVFRNAEGMASCGTLVPEEAPGAEPGLPWTPAFEFCLPAAEVASVTAPYFQDVLVIPCGSTLCLVPQGCGAQGAPGWLLSFSNADRARTSLMPLFKYHEIGQ